MSTFADTKRVESLNSSSSNARSPSPSSRNYRNRSPTPSHGSYNGGGGGGGGGGMGRSSSRLSYASDDTDRGSVSIQKMHSVNQEIKDKLSYKNPDLSGEEVPNYMKQTCTSLVKIQTVKMKDRNKSSGTTMSKKSGNLHRSTKSENLGTIDFSKKKSKIKKKNLKEDYKYGSCSPEKTLSCPLDNMMTMTMKPKMSSFEIHREKMQQKQISKTDEENSDSSGSDEIMMTWSNASSSHSHEINHLSSGLDYHLIGRSASANGSANGSISGDEELKQSALEVNLYPDNEIKIQNKEINSESKLNENLKMKELSLNESFNDTEILINKKEDVNGDIDSMEEMEEKSKVRKIIGPPLQTSSFAFRESVSIGSTPRAVLGNDASSLNNEENEEALPPPPPPNEETCLSTLPSVTFGGTTIIPDKEIVDVMDDSPSFKKIKKRDIYSYNVEEVQSSELNQSMAQAQQEDINDQNDSSRNQRTKTLVDIGFGAVAGAITAAIFFLGSGGNKSR